MHAEPLVRVVDPASGTGGRAFQESQRRDPQRVSRGGNDVVLQQPRVAQPLRIDVHLQLAQALAPDRHVRDTGHAQQLRLDGPAREQRELRGLDLVRRNPDHHEAAGRRQRLQNDRRRGDVGKRVGEGQAFLDHLARLDDVGAALERHHDGRQSGDRLGADRLEPGHPAKQLLQVQRDEALHFPGRETDRLGLHFDDRRRELGENVHRHPVEPLGSERDQRRGNAQHHQAELQTRGDYPAEHGPISLICQSSFAKTHLPKISAP